MATKEPWRNDAKSHEIKLQNDLIINLADKPHIIAWGKSGSGKSSLLFSDDFTTAYERFWSVFHRPKSEFSAFQEFYPLERIQEDTEAILELMRYVCGELKRRQKSSLKLLKTAENPGLRGYDIGLTPIVVVADEIGSAVASMDASRKKGFLALLTQIVQKGRSVSVFCIVATQSPKTDTTLSKRHQKSVCDQNFLWGQQTQKHNEWHLTARLQQRAVLNALKVLYLWRKDRRNPAFFFAVTDLHTHHLNDLKCFEQAYKIGNR